MLFLTISPHTHSLPSENCSQWTWSNFWNSQKTQGSRNAVPEKKNCQFGLWWQNTMDSIAYKKQKMISHSSGSWEAQDHITRMVIFWCRPFSWLTGTFWSSFHIAKWARGPCRVFFFIKTLIPFLRALLSVPKQLPKTSLPNTITLGIKVSTFELCGGQNLHTTAFSQRWKVPSQHSVCWKIIRGVNR